MIKSKRPAHIKRVEKILGESEKMTARPKFGKPIAAPKRATIGESIVSDYRTALVCTYAESDARHRKIARRIDAAIRRAVKDVWKARGQYDGACTSILHDDNEEQDRIRMGIEIKYGVKL